MKAVGERLYKICSKLKLHLVQAEFAWEIMKLIISEISVLLISNHMDQIILCAIYIVWKVFEEETGVAPSFTLLIQK